MSDLRLLTLDPAHFHAALVQKEMYAGVSPSAAIYAPLSQDLVDHLARVARFNARSTHPTSWQLDIHTGPDFLDRLLSEPPGNVVILSGRNDAKIGRILRSARAGFHVLADKPWILKSADLPLLAESLDLADAAGLTAFDIMTERFEVTSQLQRELVNAPAVFGALLPGSPADPAIRMDSMHRICKTVDGVPSLRPVSFFDVAQQGEGLSDVGTHLVDLVFWTAFPDQAINHETQVAILGARRWPTVLSAAEWRKVTGADLQGAPSFDYYCNNFVHFTVSGAHVQMNVTWDYEGVSDIYTNCFRGELSRVEVRQGEAENFRPEVYIVANEPARHAALLAAIRSLLDSLQLTYPGVAAVDLGDAIRLSIPDALRVGHEAHFAEVTRAFFSYIGNPGSLPAWEKPNMLAKYFITTRGVELAHVSV
jgi:predicted dehydrogenase